MLRYASITILLLVALPEVANAQFRERVVVRQRGFNPGFNVNLSVNRGFAFNSGFGFPTFQQSFVTSQVFTRDRFLLPQPMVFDDPFSVPMFVPEFVPQWQPARGPTIIVIR
jgi:hypothetical protein